MLSNSYSLSSYDYRPVFRSFSVSESFFLVSNPCSSTPWIWNCNWGTMVNHLITGILLTSESFISTNKHSNMVYIHYGNTWIQFLLPNHASIGSSVDVAERKKTRGNVSSDVDPSIVNVFQSPVRHYQLPQTAARKVKFRKYKNPIISRKRVVCIDFPRSRFTGRLGHRLIQFIGNN